MSLQRRSLTIVLTTLIAAAALPGQISASSASPSPTVAAAPDDRPATGRRAPSMAVGVLVRTTTPSASTGLVRAAETALPRGVDLEHVRRSAMGGRTSVLPASRRVTASEAEAVAAELRKRSDVVWASPNYVMTKAVEPPVPANDPYFTSDQNRAVWDKRSRTDSRVMAVMGATNTFGTGGFSSKVPYLWRATEGEGQVVAVLDTGITVHPDLPGWDGHQATGRILSGYDFVSRYAFGGGFFEDTGHDGSGWDNNPQDSGDWTEFEDCYDDSPAENSSWHGTHVTGIIAAAKDNARGVVGVAPSVKILPVRVLGMCGGTLEDIAAGIKWAAGVPVGPSPEGLTTPLNQNPADVINLSLAGYLDEFAPCNNETLAPFIEALTAAEDAGAVVVAAAGNEGWDLASHPAVPATCPGVISVGATSEYGDRPGYSNYGSAVDISAPGGDPFWDRRGIWSTYNAGGQNIGAATYAQLEGTSMATPVVSAGAALIKSLGDFTPEQTEAALKAAVQPFPNGAHSAFDPCSTASCGKGIISLDKVPAPLTKPSISGLVAINRPLTAALGTWSSAPASFARQWLRDGRPITGATGSTYTVTTADLGSRISVRVRPSSGVFAPITSTSPESQEVSTVTLSGLPVHTTFGATTAPAKVTVFGVGAGQTVQLRRGSTTLASGTTDAGGVATIVVPGTTWVAGTNSVRATFPGDGTNAASSAPVGVQVAKATSSITTSLPSRVRRASRALMTFTVKVAGDPGPSGNVEIFDGSRRIVLIGLSSGFKGKRSFRLPPLAKGRHSIRAVYRGNANITGRTSSSRFITSY